MIKYEYVQAEIIVQRPEIVSDMCDEAQAMKHTFKLCDIIDGLPTAITGETREYCIHPGDTIVITIKINKDTTWEDNTATETK